MSGGVGRVVAGGWDHLAPCLGPAPRSPRGHKGALRPRCQPGQGLPDPPRGPADCHEHWRGRGFPSRPQASPPPHSSARALGVVGERGLKIALGGGEAAIRGRDARLAACPAGRGLGRRSTSGHSQDAPPQAPARRPPHFLGAGHLTHSRCHGGGGVAAALPHRTPRPPRWARPAGRRVLPRPRLMTGREAVMSVWARVGRGRDERRVEGERPRGRVITAPSRRPGEGRAGAPGGRSAGARK